MKTIASAVVAFSLMMVGLAHAEVPERLVYTGALSDQGQPFEGSVDVVFSIFDTASGGTALWSESHEGVAVTGGRLTVELGLSETTLSEVFDGRKLYLDVNVDGQSMLPRVPVASVPYAFRAIDSDTVGGLTPEELGGAGAVAAAEVSYDHAQSGLGATDVQAALDELVARVDALQASHDALQTNYDNLQQAFANISWNDLADIPDGFADGVDNEAVAGSVTWTDIQNRPAGLDDGDDVGLQSVTWADIQNIPAGFADGTDDEGLQVVSWADIQNIPAGFADGVDDGLTSVTWPAVTGKPAWLADDDVDWTDIVGIPAGFADGVDNGLTSVTWNDIQNTTSIIHSGTDFIFRGLNVRVQSGSGSTAGAINGLGNLIVGYDEARASGSDKSGSHNLVVGRNHNYSSYGGIVAGYQNTISGIESCVSGGLMNTASGSYASVSGGSHHSISGTYDWQAGGLFQDQ